MRNEEESFFMSEASCLKGPFRYSVDGRIAEGQIIEMLDNAKVPFVRGEYSVLFSLEGIDTTNLSGWDGAPVDGAFCLSEDEGDRDWLLASLTKRFRHALQKAEEGKVRYLAFNIKFRGWNPKKSGVAFG